MKRKRWGQKGFSLTEVMVASVIAAGMALSLGMVLRAGARGWQARENQMTTSSELRRGIHSMARELAQTRSDQLQVLVGGVWMSWGQPPPPPSLTWPPPSDVSSYPSVRFKVPEVVAPNTTVVDATGAVTWSPNPITYDLAAVAGGGQLLQRTQGGVVSPLAYGVTALSFRRQAATPSVLEMNVTVQRGAADGAQPVILSTRIRLRN